MPVKTPLEPSITHFSPWPLVLVTSSDAQGRPNIIALAAASPCSFRPPTLGIAVAPGRYSHGLIAERGEFGVNLPARADLERADLCGCLSGRDVDKFVETGFTPLPGERIAVPLIAECPVGFECRLVHTVHLGSHDWFVGEIVAARADAAVVTAAGHVDPRKLDGVTCTWGRYFAQGLEVGAWHFAGRSHSARAKPRE